ncbi:MAG: metallophosphoesterase family protein [Planctomycetota bacterium]|nr:metallophosphoesterase family protein [Planctomycetota bacterium]
MKLVALPDLHEQISHLAGCAEALRSADLVLLPGDLTDFGGVEAASRVVEAIRAYNPRIRAVSGNCDRPEIDAYLEREGLSLHARAETIGGVAFWGCGHSLPCPSPTVNECGEADLAAALAKGAGALPAGLPHVLVVHQPPFETFADFASNGQHVGSRSVREAILTHKPLLCLTGHIHEGRGVGTLGRTTLVNPGPLRAGSYLFARIDGGRVQAEIHRIAT